MSTRNGGSPMHRPKGMILHAEGGYAGKWEPMGWKGRTNPGGFMKAKALEMSRRLTL